MSRKQKLELTWIGKENRARPEPRILVEQRDLSYYRTGGSSNDIFSNILINGDNLLALQALQADFGGKVKCIYIDPPYNTGAAFEQYDDSVEHSLWLTLMRERLELLRKLLRSDGSIWINIDDNEGHYLKVLCDEIFGRANFRACITWQKKYSVSNNFKGIASITDYILVYGKSDQFSNNLLPRSDESKGRYSNPDDDPRGPWKAVDYLNQATPSQRPNLCYAIINPNTKQVIKNTAKAWKYDPEVHKRHVAENRVWWGRAGNNTVPALKLFLSEVRDGLTPHNWWPHDEVGHTDEAKKESIGLFGTDNVFATPKPERLIQRILTIATEPGDIVLDSFAGSGTTGAVAHKMGRRWIMVELGDHAKTHIAVRLRKVIDGTDVGGVSERVGWERGGGFGFFRLAPSLLERDRWGNWVVSKEYNAAMLAEAMCKHMGFTYAPSQDQLEYWNHGYSTESDFIFVTTQALTHSMLAALSHDVGPDCHLLICCKAFSGRTDQFTNLSVRRIPQAVLANCEWGRDDYSLRIANLPTVATVDYEEPPPEQAPHSKGARRKSVPNTAPDLFGQPAEREA